MNYIYGGIIMKRKNLRLYTISACLVLGLSLAGCGKNETECDCVRVNIRSTNGCEDARVYEVRVY